MHVRKFRTEDGNWDDVISSLAYYTIFNTELFINALGFSAEKLVIENNDEVIAALALVRSGDKICRVPIPFAPYNGLMIKNKNLIEHKRIAFETKAVTTLIDYLINQYGEYSISLAPEFTDIRPFYWDSYERKRDLDVTVRYTGYLELENISLDDCIKNLRSVRRQEYNKFVGRFDKIISVDDFLFIYKKMFYSKGIDLLPEDISPVRLICECTISKGIGYLTGAYNHTGVLVSAALFLVDRKKAYYMFGANDPDYKKLGAGTALLLHNIKQQMIRGVQQIDFVGVNSPGRGDYKTSFNLSLKPYYIVNYCNR